MDRAELIHELKALQDPAYVQLQQKILPNVQPDTIIGVRTPQLRAVAARFGDPQWFLEALPHGYFEENQLHAFLIAREKDYHTVIAQIEAFLPYVDNWATCDQMNPAVLRKHRQELLVCIRRWIKSEHPYTVRFGLKMLMDHFLDADFRPEYLELAASVHSEEYYVRMMVAWFFATAMAKQYDAAMPYIREYRLSPWVHNKAITKSVESFRVIPEHKAELKRYRTRPKA